MCLSHRCESPLCLIIYQRADNPLVSSLTLPEKPEHPTHPFFFLKTNKKTFLRPYQTQTDYAEIKSINCPLLQWTIGCQIIWSVFIAPLGIVYWRHPAYQRHAALRCVLLLCRLLGVLMALDTLSHYVRVLSRDGRGGTKLGTLH